MAGSEVIADATIHALNYKQAKLKIMLWASGARPPPINLINYTLCD
jgi:hypothetical protein